MKGETLNFLNSVFAGNQSVMELVSGNYTFMDQRMSQHYGITGNNTDQFVRVNLDSKRAGILTQPSILTLTSTAQRTSPVVRGKWFLEQILCSGTGGPPAEVPIVNTGANGQAFTESQIRERLAAHAAQGAACTSCHRVLDPIGLAYENYDAAGMYRTRYLDGVNVNASGQLPTGEVLRDFTDLAKVVQSDPRFKNCFTEKLASFANGRDLGTQAGKCMTRTIASKSIGTQTKFSDVVQSIVEHETFRVRKVKY
ncbi:MAG: DUF1588 domain-containing protein [Proteobacteria bacterium]|nr:MAG: DUF1588 domain-containing protein [Pseudomonadota bacterium]